MKRRGLSLLEIVFAVFLVLMAVSYLMTMFVSGSKPDLRAQDMSTVNFLARSKMESYMAIKVDNLTTRDDPPVAFPAPYEKYTFKTAISIYTDPMNSVEDEVKQIRVTVTSPNKLSQTLCAIRAPDPTPGEDLYRDYGCGSCHEVKAYGFTGTAGPSHDGIATTAARRVPGKSAREYLKDSIRDPEAYVVSPYTADMQGAYTSDLLPDGDMRAIINFMMTLK